jgi:hypothetical protein
MVAAASSDTATIAVPRRSDWTTGNTNASTGGVHAAFNF